MLGISAHEPLRRIQQHQGNYSLLPNELVSEETPCLMSSTDKSMILPNIYVSVPSMEEGHVSLKQQSTGAMASEDQSLAHKDWHHKAIRRNLSKAKELVLFVGGLKCNLPSPQYVSYAIDCAKTEKKSSIGPVFPTLGCFFVTFLSGTSAAAAFKSFKGTEFQGKLPELIFLPFISVPKSTDSDRSSYEPLLVFINYRSGGGQGNQLQSLMLETLNSNQVFMMDKGGAMPGFYAFRKLHRFRVLVCGGDGTVGWVLSHLEVVQRHLLCRSPPVGVLPVGTGNDLARVLGFGSGWSGDSVDSILVQIEESEPVQLDRWNVMFDSSASDKLRSPDPLLLSDAVSFREENDTGRKAPVSPINIVMSVGTSIPTFFSSTTEPNHKDGVKSLITATLPLSIPDSRNNSTSRNSPNTKESSNRRFSGDIDNTPWKYMRPLSRSISTPVDENLMKSIENDNAENETDDIETVFNEHNNHSFSETKLRQRSQNSKRHRLVQILSESDLEFGPFISFEESQADENGDSVETLKCKANKLKLVDNDCNAMSSHSGTTDCTVSIQNNVIEDGFLIRDVFAEGSEITQANNMKQPSPQHARLGSEGTVTYEHKETLPFHKTLSLPIDTTHRSEKISTPDPTDDVKLISMSNYFGIGIDAELSLAFHLAREENPEKCTSRLRNKALYFKAGLKKMTSRSVNLNHVIELEVNNENISLPSIRGLIFLNIGSWGAGANAWGSAVSKRFSPPSMGDGMLEVIGVGGVAHMSQIYSGLRSGIRIAQGEFVRMNLKAEVAVQIDGEPWMQPPGKIVISTSQQATMLKRTKKKSK